MAQKHKSKYKAPKDLEKSQKPKPRKDLKDYTEDDKKGALNPHSTGDKQLNVLRKTDKEMIDTGDLYPKYNDDDRLYKDLEDGDYDPKLAAKRLKKRQDKEEKETADVLKDKIENLTREQKERLIREYIRRKIYKVLVEQPNPDEKPTEETPAETPTEETPAEETPAADTPATPTDTAATTTPATPTTPTTPTDTSAATTPTDTVATTSTTPTDTAATTPTDTAAAGGAATPQATDAEELSPEEKEALSVEKFIKQLKSDGGNIARIKTLAKVFNRTLKDAEPEDQRNFYKLLRQLSIKKLSIGDGTDSKKSEKQ